MGLVCKAFGDIITFTRASTGTFTGSNGLIQSAAINAPRFDYDPVTLAAKGLLIEEQRTNLALYSDDYTNAVWQKTNASVTANTAVSPDGSTNADKLVEDTATGIHRTFQQIVCGVGNYTCSVYCKAAERTRAVISMSDGSTGDASVGVDLSNGTTFASGIAVGSWTNITSSVTAAGSGWYRVIVSATRNAGTITTPTIWIDNGSGTSYTGNGTSGVFIWGAQLEAGSFATSYIPTVASQVTRSADVASVNTLSPWYNATEGTLYAEGSGLSSAGNRLASLDPGPSNLMYVSLAQTSVVTGGVSQATFNYSPVANTTYKQALAYKTNDFAAARDGTVATDTSGSVPSVSKLSIGNIDSSSLFIGSGYIRRITYYPRRLSNAELQAITA